MSFITQPDRIYISDSSGVVKFDTNEPHPIVYSRIQGTATFSSTVSSFTFTVPVGEGTGTETRYTSNGINSNYTIYTAPAGTTLNFCLSSIRLTSSTATGTSETYNYYRVPLNTWISANGSVVIDRAVTKAGKVERVTIATIYATNNTVVLNIKRTAYSDDVSGIPSYTFEYNVLACKLTS